MLAIRYPDFFCSADKYGILSEKVGITFTDIEKTKSYFEEVSHRGNITFSIIATGNQTAEGGET